MLVASLQHSGFIDHSWAGLAGFLSFIFLNLFAGAEVTATCLVVNGWNYWCDVFFSQIQIGGACIYQTELWLVPTVANSVVSFCILSRHVMCCVTRFALLVLVGYR